MTPALQLLLAPLAALYALTMRLRNLVYDGLERGGLLDGDCGAVVVSIGNLSVGGTGKTPMTLFFAERWRNHARLGVVSRGYGRSTRGSHEVDAKAGDCAERFGDEPCLIAARTGLPVQVGEKRVQAARDLVARSGVRLVLLDDAFQHRAIRRDLNLVLIDVTRPDWEQQVLPAGRWRESLAALDRADAILLTKVTTDAAAAAWQQKAERALTRSQPVIWMRQSLAWPAMTSAEPLILAAGLAHPETFFEMVRAHETRPQVRATFGFSDHHRYTLEDAERLYGRARELGCRRVLVTEKDFTKLLPFWPADVRSGESISLESSRLAISPARELDSRELEKLDEQILGRVRGLDRQASRLADRIAPEAR